MKKLVLNNLKHFSLNTIIKLFVIAVLFMTIVVLYSLNNKLNKEQGSQHVRVSVDEVSSISK